MKSNDQVPQFPHQSIEPSISYLSCIAFKYTTIGFEPAGLKVGIVPPDTGSPVVVDPVRGSKNSTANERSDWHELRLMLWLPSVGMYIRYSAQTS
jgi:hypothetical protein